MQNGWLRRVGPWVGIGTSPAAMMMGGGVAEGVADWLLPTVLVVGAVLLATLAGGQGILGQTTGKPLLTITAGALGSRASRVTAAPVIFLMMLGWFALNVSVAGTALGRLVHMPDRLGMVLFAAAMLAVVWFGVDALSWSALVAGLATVAIAIEGIGTVARNHDLSLLGDQSVGTPIGAVPAVALVIGYGAAFALRTPDFTRDLRSRAEVVRCAVIGLCVPLIAFGIVGAMLQRSTGMWNLADVLQGLGSPTIAYLFVAIGFSGSVMSNLYSGALSLSDATPRIGYRTGLVVVAVIGSAVAALRFSQWMIPYLTTMALVAPPLIALCWLTSMGARRMPMHECEWRPSGVTAWGLGVATGLSLHAAGAAFALPAGAAVTTICAVALLRGASPREIV